MSNKLNLEVGRGNGYDAANKYSLKFALKNFDTTTVALSALRVTAYGWFPQRNILSQFTSGVNFSGNLLQVVSAIDPYYGVGQTGIVPLNTSTTTYRVNHTVVDSSKISPQLTINVPSGGSSIGTVSFINSTDTYFDIVMDDPPPTAGYTVTWFLPGTTEVYTGSPTAISNPNILIEKLQTPYIRVKNRKADTKIVFSWNGSTTLIPQNWGVSGIDAYVEIPNLYPSNNILSAWYSKPEGNVLDNPYFVLEQFNGSSWEVVSEYDDASTLDAQTGVIPSDNLFLKIESSATGKGVYITPTSGNPIAGSVFDRNNLSLYSKGSSGDKRRRSLLKFETSAIPSSATSVKNAVLRLNVNSLSNAWNYSSTNGHISVYRITSDWTENEATWTNRKTGIPWTVSGGDYYDSPAIWLGNSNLSNSFTSADQNSQFWVDFDVTTIVEHWRQNPSQNYGFLIKLYDSNNENSLSDIKWELNSNRLFGTGVIAGYPELLISYNTLNVSGPTPTITITEPNTNDIILTPIVTFNATSTIAGGSVESVGLYYREKNSISPYTFLTNLYSTDYVNWFVNFLSLDSGEYDFVARATSDLGNVGESLPVRLNFSSVPQVTFNTNGICYDSSIDVTGTFSQAPISGFIQYNFQDIPNDKKITKIIEDKLFANILWIATEGNGLIRLDKTTNDIRRFNTSNSSLISNYIVDISMETNGLLWMSLRNELDQRGMGLVSFNTTNYLNPSSVDFSFYNTTNSPLSAYSPTKIDINSVHVDSSNNKWIGLTWQSINSVIKFTGYVFDSAHSTIHNINIYPRKIVSYGSTVYVSNDDNQVAVFNGSWNVYNFTTQITSIYPESSSKLWVGMVDRIGFLDSGVVTEVLSENTPAFSNGLSSAAFHNVNKRVSDVFVDSSNNKWFSFSTGSNGEYNGGFVKYSGSNLLSGTYTNSSNWDSRDKSNFSGILDNNLYQTLTTTDLGICVVSVSGLSIYDYSGWRNFSNTYGKQYPIVISGNSYSANISNPKYGNTTFDVNLDYGNSNYLVSSFSTQIEKGLSVSTLYPANGFGAVSGNTTNLVYKTSFDNIDISNGDMVTTKLCMSTNENSGWQLVDTRLNQASPEFKLNIPKEQFFYFKTIVENQNCVTESSVGLVYGMSDLLISANNVSGTTNTKDPIVFSGRVYDKDFTRTLSVNGNNFTDSILNIKAEYISGANAVLVGYANVGSQSNGYVDFTFDWNSPIANVSALRFTATTTFGNVKSATSTFSSVKSVPTISILSPIQNQIIARNSSIVLSATASYVSSPVSALAFYGINNTSSTYFGSATSGASGWTKTITPSALGIDGSYSLYASAVDNVGTSSVSNPIDFSVNYPPTLTPISNLSATHDGTYQFVASIYDQNAYYGNKIEILSGGSVYYTGYANGFGEFVWNWVSPPNGSTILSAKVYDGNPTLSSDYSLTQLSFNLNLLSVTLLDPGFPSAKYNNVTLTPKVNVVRADTPFTISATVTGVFDYVNYWLCEEDEFGIFRKKSILATGTASNSVSLPTSRYYDDLYVSKYKFYGIVAEVVSLNNSSIDSNVVKFYSKEQSLEVGLSTSVCQNPITFSGKVLDSDLPYYTVSNIVDNSVSAYIWDSSNLSAIGSFWIYSKDDEYRTLTYDWNNPTSSTSAVEVRVVDQYSISASEKIVFGQIETNPTLTLSAINPSKYISAVGTAYLVSASTFSVSSNASSPYISAFNYKLTYQDNSVKSVSSTNSNPHISNITLSGTEGVVFLNGEYTTSGKCTVYSDSFFAFAVLSSAFGSLSVDNCSNCYCSSGSLNVTATINDSNFNNTLLIDLFGYSSSAVVYDDFNNIVYSKELTETSSTFNFVWNNPAENSTYLKLRVINKYGLYADYIKYLSRQIFKSPGITTIAPVDFSASNYIYKQNQDIVVQTINSSDVTQLKYYVDGLLVGIINNPATTQTFTWSKDKFAGSYVIEIMALNGTGCYSKSTKTVYCSNGPIVSIISPSANSWVNSGSQLDLFVDVKDSGSSISSVKLYSSLGTSAEAYYNPTNRMWYGNLSSASSAVSNISLSAIAYDVSGNNTLKVNVINVAKPPLVNATVSGNISATINYNTEVTIDLSGSSLNGSSVIGYSINGTFVSATSSQANVTLPVAVYFTSGLNQVEVIGLDYYGSTTSESIFLDVIPFTDDLSYPIIRYLNSTPENKIDADKITTYFEITDYTNKIAPSTIGLGENSRGTIITSGIQVVDDGKKYVVPVEVVESGSVIISAYNLVGQSATFEEQNYIIRCKNGRLINITNFLPQYLRDDSSGNESEFFKFTKFFEDYLNTMYKSFDESCNLSILEKINKIQSLHDIDTIDPIYIQQYANMLGYGVDINNDELGTFTTNSSTVYADSNDVYKNKILRFVIGNLPNWYAIKTTRNAVKMMLLSFGIIGDLIEYYTLDYDKSWKANRTKNGQYVSDEMTKEWYPTPHISLGVDLMNSDNSVVYNSDQIKNIVNAMEDIRPANVVINGIQGYVSETPVQTVYLNISFRTTKNINVTRNQQINIK